MGNRLCKACGSSYKVESTRKSKRIKSPACSLECKSKLIMKKRSCLPVCDKEDALLREVTFKDGSTHIQRYCNLCLKTSFVEKYLAEGFINSSL